LKPIKKLDTQLANQIAAGEVVERPASVVKELLENSLDAGANRVDIEITSGGVSLIRIRDNGSGIPKHELELALSPHATSKITRLDDLDEIRSFGFRGEALSSICSISKFKLSSRIKNSEQGWQAETEGRDMRVKLTPVAVAEGTRIDVRELFFNTPARRRFLRTEKTEFSHIEAVVKKVALANFKVALTLKHNGRMSRRFRAAHDLQQQEQRVAAVCGRQFMQRSVRLDLEHQGIELSGWLALPDYHKSQNDSQYFYVNNRPVRDKVLNHAIRQAYQRYIPEGRVPAYVLFLTIDPAKVDVNVHPTKHEVRFHDGRFIHDLLVQAIERGLNEGKELVDNSFLETDNDRMSVSEADAGQWTASADRKQHQAYRSLLESATSSEGYHSIAESIVSNPVVLEGWRFLTRLSDEYLLIEKDNELFILSVCRLLKLSISQYQSGDSSEPEKLLFPEIINCTEHADAISVADFLGEFGMNASVSDSRVTVEKVPRWMIKKAIKLLCHELIRSTLRAKDHKSSDLSLPIENVPSETESIIFLLELLIGLNDISKLHLKKISKTRALELLL